MDDVVIRMYFLVKAAARAWSAGGIFLLFKPAPQETMRDFYAELPISLRIIGKYHDMGAFTSDIAQLSRIVTLNEVALNVSKDGNLVMDTTARTFRYLDDEEIAAQRRAADAAKAAKK